MADNKRRIITLYYGQEEKKFNSYTVALSYLLVHIAKPLTKINVRYKIRGFKTKSVSCTRKVKAGRDPVEQLVTANRGALKRRRKQAA